MDATDQPRAPVCYVGLGASAGGLEAPLPLEAEAAEREPLPASQPDEEQDQGRGADGRADADLAAAGGIDPAKGPQDAKEHEAAGC